MEQPGREFSSEIDRVPLSWHGEVMFGNYDAMCAYNAQYKQQRLAQLRCVTTILEDAGVPYWIDCGTLLGAYRCNGMIPHDNDTDVAIFGDEDFERGRKALEEHLPAEYSMKVGTSYSDKLEVNHDASGVFYFSADVVTSNVSCDVYKYKQRPNGTLQMQYFKCGVDERQFQHDWVFPLDTVKFEDMTLKCARNKKAYVEEMYGYTGEDFRFDPETQKFVQWTWPKRGGPS